jgi:cytochrome c biogenesis protein CcmG, thiol:disulfide interchange protein DsbE
VTARSVVRGVAAAGVGVLAVLLVWHLTHQPKSVLKAVAHHKVVPAPNFTLDRLNGPGRLSLASLRGKAVVVNFWASDCVPCKEEMPRLVAFARSVSPKQVVVVGIDVMELRKGPGRAFSERYDARYPMVFDPEGTTVVPWGVGQGTPQTFFVDRRGRIVNHVLGPVSAEALRSGVARALRA